MNSSWFNAFFLLISSTLVENLYLNSSEKINVFKLPLEIESDDVLETYGNFMLSIMNREVNPCEDFYEYACGNWQNAEDVPIKSRNGTYLNAIQESISQLTTQFLSKPVAKDENRTTAEFKTRSFYQNCISMGQNLAEGYQKLLLWPEFQNKQIKDWMDINFMSTTDMHVLLPLKTAYNSETRKTELLLMPPRAILGDAKLVNVQNLTAALNITDIAAFEQEFSSMLSFEANLTSITKTRAANETERLKLKDFLVKHSKNKFNWSRFFQAAFNGSQNENWLVQNKLQDAAKLAHFLNKQDAQTLINYVKWRTLIKFYYIWTPINNITHEEHCRVQTEQYFSYALVPFLVTSLYDLDKRADILSLAGNIKSIFYNFIENAVWLDENTRSQARTKLNVMDVKAGYIDILARRAYMNEIYNEVNISENWFDNVLALEVNRAKLKRLSVDKVLIPPPMFIGSANAYYVNFLNEVFVAIGLTQFPLYHLNFPAALKYGGIGHIVGHEVAHAFDNAGFQFDYDGRNRNWWSEQSLLRFRERFRCFESQYSRFIFQGVATNGSFTLSDNIADNVGTRLAYQAYLKTTAQRDLQERALPNVNLNNRQLFFMRFAQTWCTGQNIETTLKHLNTDVHAFGKFRVIGTLRNMPEFSEAFQCKLGTSMNPLRKCKLW